MLFRLAVCASLLAPAIAEAQAVPSIYPISGLNASSAGSRVERSGLPVARPRYDVLAMNGSSAPFFRRVKPAYRFAQTELNIPEVYELIFFGDDRAAHVRLHVKVAGGTLAKTWVEQLRRYFDFLDRDGDGVLNPYEAEFVFSNRTIQQLLSAGPSFANPYDSGRRLTDFDRDGDGKISFDEFLAYYLPSAAALLRNQPSVNRDTNGELLTDGIFKLLDRDRDGKLSKQELQEAESLLSSLDANEDECLSALELVPNLYSQPAPTIDKKEPKTSKAAPHTSSPLQIFRSGALPDLFVEELLLRYDRDKNLRLSKSENCFDETTFAKLDKNSDGELTIPELMAWKDFPPDLLVEMVIGPTANECKLNALTSSKGKSGPGAIALSGGGSKAFIQVGVQRIDLGIIAGNDLPAPPSLDFNSIYQQADPQNRGYFTETEIVGPQFQLVRILFDFVDRDGDGRVTRKEFDRFFELQQEFANLPLAIAYQMQPPSLFGLIDSDGDGRLSVPELRNAWKRLRELEPAGGEFITRTALRPQPVVRLVRGNLAQTAFAARSYQPSARPTSVGPAWFRKMDRNNDGVISRSEFPGRSADFDKIDLDHDGLITAEEADAAEKQYRPANAANK